MKILNKKILREFKSNKSQFLTIFLMVFLGVLVFSGIHAYMDGMKYSGNEFYEKYNLQDLWVTSNEDGFTDDDIDEILKIDNVSNAEKVLTVTTNVLDYDGVSLETNFIDSNTISTMYVVEGENFSKNKSGIWLDSYLAKNLEIKVGDTLKLQYDDYTIEEKVLGLVLTPDHVYIVKNENEIFPTHKDFGFCYLSIDEFPKDYIYDKAGEKTGIPFKEIFDFAGDILTSFNIDDYIVYNQVLVTVYDTDKIDETKSLIENKLDNVKAVTGRTSNTSYSGYQSEIEEGETYSSVFTIMFIFIAILTVITTMNRFVKKQRTQIGTLKALGIKTKSIIKHYISYGLILSIVAGITGIIAGEQLVGKFFLNMEMSYFEVPNSKVVIIPEVYIVTIAIILLITFITYLSCNKILKEPAVESLRLEVPKMKKFKESRNNALFKKLSLSTKWNLRDVSRNKFRTLTGIVGICGCMMLLVCAFGMLDSMNNYLDWEFNDLCNFNNKITFKYDIKDEEREALLNKFGNGTTESLGIEFKFDGKNEATSILINDAGDYLNYSDHDRNHIKLSDDGIFVTEKFASKYNLNVGDTISWHEFGEEKWYESKIVGLNRDPQNQNITTTRNYFETLGIEYEPDTIYFDDSSLIDINKLDSGIDSYSSLTALKEGIENMLETMKSMVILLVVVSVILGSVIIYNLGILSFTEKEYQFATLKVLGFQNKKIEKIFVKQNIWITVVAIIIGAPMGYMLTDVIFKYALGDNYDFSAYIKLISYLYAIIGTILVSLFVNRKLAKKVKTIDMVTSLKFNE